MTAIQNNNALKEYIKSNMSTIETLIFEHLSNGYFHIYVHDGYRGAGIRTSGNFDIEQLSEVGNALIIRLNERLKMITNPIMELMECITVPSAIVVHKELVESLESLKDEIKDEDENNVKKIAANRRWLRQHNLGFSTSEQNYKFHELANQAREESVINDLDESLLKVYIKIISEI